MISFVTDVPVHDDKPELARLSRLRKRQIKGLLGRVLINRPANPLLRMKRLGLGEELAKKQSEMKFSTQHTARVLAGAILLISLGGCGAIDLVATKIGDYKQFKVPNVDTFLILDDINAQKIKITMSTAAKTSAFMNNILTFGLSYPDASEGKMKSAAVDYLKSTDRNCTIVSDKKVERMEWEFQYHCEAKTEQEEKKS